MQLVWKHLCQFFSTSWKCSWKCLHVFFLFLLCRFFFFLHSVRLMQEIMTSAAMNVDRSLMLMDRFWDAVSVLEKDKFYIVSVCMQLKVFRWLSSFSALQWVERCLYVLCLRLKDASGETENTWLILGSFCRILKFLRMMLLIVMEIVWVVGEGELSLNLLFFLLNSISRSNYWTRCFPVLTVGTATSFKELAHFLVLIAEMRLSRHYTSLDVWF